jgi:hypothetical protein
MKQICSARLLIGTAFLFASSAAGLMAQTEVGSNGMPHETLPLVNLLSQTDKSIIDASPSNVVPDTSVGLPKDNAASSARTSAVPGTIAKSSATPLKPSHNSAFSVEPDYLPSWITNQPFAYLRYGAAPAVVTLHFGQK